MLWSEQIVTSKKHVVIVQVQCSSAIWSTFHEDALPRFHYLVLSSFVGVRHAAIIVFLLRRRRWNDEAVMKYALENDYFDHQKIENDLKFSPLVD